MKLPFLLVAVGGSAILAACATSEPPPPPLPPGSIQGSVAADRNGDGIVDGYYTSDGVYHPNYVPPPPPPPPPQPTGERG